MSRTRKKTPQPPIDRQRHPTGVRPLWLGVALAVAGGAMTLLGPWHEHDVFGDASKFMVAWRLTEAVTRGDVKHPGPATPKRPVNLPVTTVPAGQAPRPDVAPNAAPAPDQDQAPDVQNGDDYCKT